MIFIYEHIITVTNTVLEDRLIYKTHTDKAYIKVVKVITRNK